MHALDVDEHVGGDEEDDDELHEERHDPGDDRLAELEHLRHLVLEAGENADEALADEVLEAALRLGLALA